MSLRKDVSIVGSRLRKLARGSLQIEDALRSIQKKLLSPA